MIPQFNIVAWSAKAPWPAPRQVEQDLIISRALVEIFSDPFLQAQLRFRGGTALNKLFFPKPLRYSEDIDLTRTAEGPFKPIIDHLRDALEPWLGKATYDRSATAPKLRFRVPAEDGSGELKLKVEINTEEIEAYDQVQALPFSVENPWFNGAADISTFSFEEILATKLRALLQRDKGRDLLDLSHSLDVRPNLSPERIVTFMGRYLAAKETRISRAQAEERMFAKLTAAKFIRDMRPLLPPDSAAEFTDDAVRKAFVRVFRRLINAMPGTAWARTPEMIERFEIDLSVEG